jgi:hypothetical protein
MSEPAWQQARLIPTSGINGAQEQERRATSALLAVMTAVREYGRTLTKAWVPTRVISRRSSRSSSTSMASR